MPRKSFTIGKRQVVVLPPLTVDNQSDCEAVDEHDLVSVDNFSDDMEGFVEVQNDVGKHCPEVFAPQIKTNVKTDRVSGTESEKVSETYRK